MSIRLPIAAAAVLLATASVAYATTITGTYTAVPNTSAVGTPRINVGNASYYLAPSFSENLTPDVTTKPQNFLLVSPTHGAGLVTGSVVVAFTFSGPSGSAVTGVTYSTGANVATLINGKVQVNANYAINYTSQTDCITWAGTCAPPARQGPDTTALGNTLAVTFADGAVLDVNLYNWADWDMQPEISFNLMTDPTNVPEPASLALLGTGIIGLGVMQRRQPEA